MFRMLCRMMGISTRSARSGRTPAQRTCAEMTKTHITGPSGRSTAGLSWPQESSPGDPYREICDELYRLLTRKRGYYGCREDPLENALGVEEDGLEAWKYQVARVGEKTRRLRGPLSAIDREKTLMDIAGHAVVAIACERRKGGDHVLGRPARGCGAAQVSGG